MDYYSILGVKSDASFQQIAQAYRRLALTLHPQKNLANKAATNFQFCQICEAFEVLSTGKCKQSSTWCRGVESNLRSLWRAHSEERNSW
jgi:DnaJ-class molecular chaperone